MSAPVIWPYAPAICPACSQSGVPTWSDRRGWLMPRHDVPIRTVRAGESSMCPASKAAVCPPQEHPTITRLREQEIPEARGLSSDENPMEGPPA